MGKSVFKGKVLPTGEKAALEERGRETEGKRPAMTKVGLWGDEPRHSGRYGLEKKKKKKEDDIDAVSYYKPHPHLKCPRMQSVL